MKTVAVEHLNFQNDQRVRIEWFLSRRCNFNCSYCDEFTHDNTSGFPSLETMKNTINTVMEKTDKQVRISFTGGEPTICKHLIDFCKYAKETYGERISELSLTTNGSRSKEYYLELTKWVDNVIFSYHMEYHKREKVPESIKAVHFSKNCNMHVHLMMLPTMFDEAKELIDDLRQNGIKVSIRRIRPAYDKEAMEQGVIRWVLPNEGKTATLLLGEDGRPDYSRDEGYYSPEEMEYLEQTPISDFNNVVTFEQEGLNIIKREENVNAILLRKENKYRDWLCWAGITSLRINANGDVFNATCRTQKLGNIQDEFTMNNEPQRCPSDWCTCAADLNTTKVKDEIYAELVRVRDEV